MARGIQCCPIFYFFCPTSASILRRIHVYIHISDSIEIVFELPLLLAPWYRVLLEKLTGLQLVKKFPTFHGTRRFITALTSVRHLALSWASPIRSIYPRPTSWKPILVLSTHLRLGLPSRLLPSGFPSKTLYTPSPHPYAPHAQPISFFSILSPAQYWMRSTSHLAPRYAISSIPPVTSSILGPNILLDTIVNQIILRVKDFLYKSGALRSVDYWIFITGVPVWRWLDEFVTLDKTFYNLLFKQEAVAAPVTSTLSSFSHSSRRPLLVIQ